MSYQQKTGSVVIALKISFISFFFIYICLAYRLAKSTSQAMKPSAKLRKNLYYCGLRTRYRQNQ